MSSPANKKSSVKDVLSRIHVSSESIPRLLSTRRSNATATGTGTSFWTMTSSRSSRVFSEAASAATSNTSISTGAHSVAPKLHAARELSRIERFALNLIESPIIRLGESDSFWRAAESLCAPTSQEPLMFGYPPLFKSLCICDAKISGNAVLLNSADAVLTGPRTLATGPARFLNLPKSLENNRVLSAQPRPSGQPAFHLEFAMPLVSAIDGSSNSLTLIACMDITESILALAHRLLQRYSVSNEARVPGCAKVTEEIDWLHVAHETAADHQRSTHGIGLRAAVPLADGDVIEFHRYIEDIAGFHKDFFTLTPGTSSWQILNISSALALHKDDVEQGMSASPHGGLRELGDRLAGQDAFCSTVCWGLDKKQKRIYCVPMFRAGSTTRRPGWLCFLISEGCPIEDTKDSRAQDG